MMPKKSLRQKVPLPDRGRAGRPSGYKPEYVNMAKQAAKLGATDADLAKIFGVSNATIDDWKAQHPDFLVPRKAARPRLSSASSARSPCSALFLC